MTLKEAQETFIDARGKSTEDWELVCWKIGKAIMDGYVFMDMKAIIRELESKKFLDTGNSDAHAGFDAGISAAIEVLKGVE